MKKTGEKLVKKREALLAHADAGYAFALSLTGNAEAAEELCQEAFLRAIEARESVPSGGAPRARFMRFVYLTALSGRRGEKRRRARERRAAMERKLRTASPDETAAARESAERVRVAVAGLREELRAPVHLHYLQGLTCAEAGGVLGLSPKAVERRVERALSELRRTLSRAGLAFAPAAILNALSSAPALKAPAALASKLGALASGAKTGAVGAGAMAAAAAKGGLAMKVVAGIVAAGTLAGAVAVSTGNLFSAGGGDGKPALVNPYKGMQEREEVYEFTTKPAVKKDGGKWVITFASKGKCDATVAILDGKGRIVRHLASGVLGANAPHPFEQNALSQKVEWDGTNDQGKKAPAGCKVRVSLGLAPVFEMNIGYDPYDLPVRYYKRTDPQYSYLVAKGAGGERYILCITQKGGYQGRVFDKDGKYVRTFWPPAAKDVQKLAQFKPLNPRDGYRFAETTWGDKVLVCGSYGPTMFNGDARKLSAVDIGKAMFHVEGVTGYKEEKVFPAGLAAKKLKLPATQAWAIFNCHCPRLVADRYREEIYAGFGNLFRFDGKTGKYDAAWTPRGELRSATEGHVGPDGLLYLRVGGANYGQWVIRMDHDGKVVPFTGDGAAPMPQKEWPDAKGKGFYCGNGWSKALTGQNVVALWTGARSHSNVHTRGLYVSPRGIILAVDYGHDKTWGIKHGIPAEWPTGASQLGAEYPIFKGNRTCVTIWDKDGNILTANAVGNMQNGHGVAMDRDGNIYSSMGYRVPEGQKTTYGIADKVNHNSWGGQGSLFKFRGGVPFPRGKTYHLNETVPGTATKLRGWRGDVTAVEGALWIWGGLLCQSDGICTCHNIRYDMDYFARHWIPSNQLYSVMVLDANGNRIARLGRYGNVDDTDADVAAGKDGLRFVWTRALAVSDTALYVTDTGNRRILKAKISYHAEETVGLDGSTSAPTPKSAPTATAPVEPKLAAMSPAATPAPATRSPAEVCRGWWSLAMSYKRAGRKDKAREYFQKIIDEHPENEYAARAGKELARL